METKAAAVDSTIRDAIAAIDSTAHLHSTLCEAVTAAVHEATDDAVDEEKGR